ncbi:hypothetical protein H8S33_00530 [Ornithinibacillus sp. BX22]|uniref:Uncharacterized protein n=1 Tax=Ornithinibacillus hominis TaxID=2763055 RepID=A0A923L2J4_9BACI|nr:hypothetical protein [Ornithinibacillus hominis]MBC5635297.1 hypothetical protein [Ornithinibacillus hominis]
MKNKAVWGIVVLVVVLAVLIIWWIQSPQKEAEDNSEYEEQERIRDFFTELRQHGGYLYTGEEELFFLNFNEALLEGELTGNLLIIEHTDDKNNPYKETSYQVNGITDGHILELYTTVDGESVELAGQFHDGAERLELSFWMTEDQLMFHAVTEEEFNQFYEEYN